MGFIGSSSSVSIDMNFRLGCAVWSDKGWVGDFYLPGSRPIEFLHLYFFVHCPIEARSPGTARYFQQILVQRGIPVSPLPWSNIQQSPDQLSLF